MYSLFLASFWSTQFSTLAGEVLNDSLSINQLLGHESSSSNHGKTAILEFLGLKGKELSRVLRLQAKRIKSKVTRDVGLPQHTRLVKGDILWFLPSNLGTLSLSTSNSSSKEDPEDRVHLRDVSDGRARDLSIEQECLALNSLSNQESQDSQHTDTSVGELSLAVSLQSWLISLGTKSKRIKEANRLQGSRDSVNREGLRKEGGERLSAIRKYLTKTTYWCSNLSSGLLSSTETVEGTSGASEESDGGGDLHGFS